MLFELHVRRKRERTLKIENPGGRAGHRGEGMRRGMREQERRKTCKNLKPCEAGKRRVLGMGDIEKSVWGKRAWTEDWKIWERVG